MNKLSQKIKTRLDEEMFELIYNDTTNEDEIAEFLSEILYEDFGFSDADSIATAEVYVAAHYVDVASDVALAQQEASRDYYDLWRDYQSSVLGAC